MNFNPNPEIRLVDDELLEAPNVNDIQLKKTLKDWIEKLSEFEENEIHKIEIADQKNCIADHAGAQKLRPQGMTTELSIAFSGSHTNLAYPIAIFRQLAVMDPLEIERFLSYQLNLLNSNEKNEVLFILQLENEVIPRLKLFSYTNPKERLQMVHDWSIVIKRRFTKRQTHLYYNWPSEDQELVARIEVEVPSKLPNRVEEDTFKKFMSQLRKKNLVNKAPIMTQKDHVALLHLFNSGGGSKHEIKKLGVNLLPKELAVFFRLVWEHCYRTSSTDERHRLSETDLFQFVINVFPGVYKSKAESFARMARKATSHAKNFEDNKESGSTSKNIQAWMNWFKKP